MNEELEKAGKIAEQIGEIVGTYCNEEQIKLFETMLNDYKQRIHIIETQKAELKKKDKMIDLMAKVIVNLDDQLVINHYENKQQCIEFVKELVEGEKKDG